MVTRREVSFLLVLVVEGRVFLMGCFVVCVWWCSFVLSMRVVGLYVAMIGLGLALVSIGSVVEDRGSH